VVCAAFLSKVFVVKMKEPDALFLLNIQEYF